MGDEVTEGIDDEQRRSLSRRGALKAGVAVGVGVAAWSGASITSFGGTPAYAIGCTGVIPPVNISGVCRNTTQATGCNPFGYQPAVFTPPSGYSLTAIGNNVCCNLNTSGTFTFPDGQTCSLTFNFYNADCGTATAVFRGSLSFAASSTSPLNINYSCPTPSTIPAGTTWPNTKYTVTAFCYTGSDPPQQGCY